MKKNIFILLTASLIVFSCKKNGDFGGKYGINGRLFLVDTVTGTGEAKPQTGKTITLAYAGQFNSNYLYTTKTDNDGYFYFPYLNSDSTYKLLYEETVSEIIYTADTSVKAEKNKDKDIAFIASPNLKKQNVLKLTLIDANNDPLPDVKCCVFTSLLLANSNPCDGRLFEITSNNRGKAFKFNLPAGVQYHINARGTYGAVILNGQLRSASISATGVTNYTIRLN
jgi:hypothetical protein